jgi:hypothetical protein
MRTLIWGTSRWDSRFQRSNRLFLTKIDNCGYFAGEIDNFWEFREEIRPFLGYSAGKQGKFSLFLIEIRVFVSFHRHRIAF